MTHHRLLEIGRAFVAVCLLSLSSVAWGHVALDDPNGGEVLDVGSTFTITWHVAVEHNLENWDLWYSTNGSAGPWIPIMMDLPPGDPSTGSVHTHDWIVPDAVSDQVRVRVRQDNFGMDYEDDSDGDLSIVIPQGNSRLNVLRLDTVPADLSTVFETLPCTVVSDLRICDEASGQHEPVDNPTMPFNLSPAGTLVLIEYDSDVTAPGTFDRIRVRMDVSGDLVVELE